MEKIQLWFRFSIMILLSVFYSCSNKKENSDYMRVFLCPKNIVDTVYKNAYFDYEFGFVDSSDILISDGWEPFEANINIYGAEITVDSFVTTGYNHKNFTSGIIFKAKSTKFKGYSVRFDSIDMSDYLKYRLFLLKCDFTIVNNKSKNDSVFHIVSYAVRK